MSLFTVQGPRRIISPAAPIARPISSAGIYDSDDKLVRTLWSAVPDHPDAADPGAAWDGRLDDGSVAVAGDYVAKRIRHNIQNTWEGVVGNTSPDHVNNVDYHNYATGMRDMAITDAGEIYFIDGYEERWCCAHVTTEDNIQEAKYILAFMSTLQTALVSCCTDGNYTYFSRSFGGGQWVWACDTAPFTYPSGNPGVKEVVTFAFGASVADNPSAIAFSSSGEYIIDIAVQKTGDFLFLSRFLDATPTGYSIWTVDKTTGETLQENTPGYLVQGPIATSPTTDNLWVAHAGASGTTRDTISELTADGAGVLTETGVHITTGLTNAIGLEVSPDGSYLLVVDLGTQQVKAFNTSDGSVKAAWGTSGAFGVAGGYDGSPEVINTKFDFITDVHMSQSGGFIAFSSDSSFWIGDGGNFRNLHFSSGNSPALIERIGWTPGGYSCRECRNDPTRIFYYATEWEIDYDVALGIDNGSWTLKRNWAPDITTYDPYTMLKYVGEYSNGRTYATSLISGLRRVYELTATGLRDTGVDINQLSYVDHELNLWAVSGNTGGGSSAEYRKIAFTGFDGSHNPTWASDPTVLPSVAVLTTETLPAGFPIVGNIDINHNYNLREVLSNGIIPVFNPVSFVSVHADSQYHFGGIDSITGEAMFQTQRPTNMNYGGVNTFLLYPDAPFFSQGSAEQSASTVHSGAALGSFGGGGMFFVPGDSFVFTQYRGENWGSLQVNVWSHWHESGLLVGQFGPKAPLAAMQSMLNLSDTDPESTTSTNFLYPGSYTSWKGLAGMAGNTFEGGVTLVDGKYYLYQNDEWYHGGIHRWRIDGMNTFELTEFPVSWDGSYSAPTDPDDLLLGLPFDQIDLPDDTAGWTRSPAADIGTSLFEPEYIRVYTSAINPDPLEPPDLAFIAKAPDVTATLSKDLPRVGSGNWTIDMKVAWPQSGGGGVDGLMLDILDSTGKRILRIKHPLSETLDVNGTHITSSGVGGQAWGVYVGKKLPLVIEGDVGASELTVTYGDYSISAVTVQEVGADVALPDVIRWSCAGLNSGLVCMTQLNWSEA